MHESYHPDQRVDIGALDRFLAQEAEKLCGILCPVMDDAFYGVSNPNISQVPKGYYESLLASDMNRPSATGDEVGKPLVFSLTNRGLRVVPAELPYDKLGAYNGDSITYRNELCGILKAGVISHEAAHHFAGHTSERSREDGLEPIAESAAMLALRAFGIDISNISLPYIVRSVARTVTTNGLLLWNPNQEGLPLGILQAQAAARQIVLAVEAGRMLRGLR